MAAPAKNLTYSTRVHQILVADSARKNAYLTMAKKRSSMATFLISAPTHIPNKNFIQKSAATGILVVDAQRKASIVYMAKRRVLVGVLTNERTQTFPPPYQPKDIQQRPIVGQQWPRLKRKTS